MSDFRTYPPVLIDEASLASAISSLRRFGRVRYSVGVDSTQQRAVDVLHRLDSLGISFVTESQERGRGRAGRSWLSPPAAGLLMSTILPAEVPAAALPAVGFWTALAVADAVAGVCGLTPAFKWPNDLLVDGAKFAGILSQARSAGASARVVVGVGANVNRPDALPEGFPKEAGWLSDAALGPVDRTALAAAILTAYEATFDLLMERPEAVVRRWRDVSQLAGKHVTVKSFDGSLRGEGTVVDVTAEGSLLLSTPAGTVRVMLADVDAR